MDFLEKMVLAEFQSRLTLKKIGTKVIARKLAKQGITLSNEQLAKIEARLESIEGSDSATIEIGDLLANEDTQNLVIDFNDSDDFEEVVAEAEKKFHEAIPNIISSTSNILLKSLKLEASRMLEEHKQIRQRFEKRLFRKWGDALNLLEMLIVIAVESGESFNNSYRPKAAQENNFVFEVLMRLHARACQIAFEILALMRAGFADGAHARWRTLHELAVMAWFIKESGNDTAEQYLLHDHIESYKAALQHQEYAKRNNQAPLSNKELTQLKLNHDLLVNRFGPNYKNRYGWASTALGKPDPKFSHIEEAVDLAHWRTSYKLASHNVHAQPKGVIFRLGLYPEISNSLLAGPSDTGLIEPAYGLTKSLTQITIALLFTEINIDSVVNCKVMIKLERHIKRAFIRANRNLPQTTRITGLRRIRRWSHRRSTE